MNDRRLKEAVRIARRIRDVQKLIGLSIDEAPWEVLVDDQDFDIMRDNLHDNLMEKAAALNYELIEVVLTLEE